MFVRVREGKIVSQDYYRLSEFVTSMERMCLRTVFVLLLLVSFQRGRSQAPGDENEFCVNLNERDPPSYSEPNRDIQFDSYNYPALVESVVDVLNPPVHNAEPVFTRYSLEGSLVSY